MARGDHPAFKYAVACSLAGGATYCLRAHLPSLVGGMGLGVGFLMAGLGVLFDKISDDQFALGTSISMSALISGVMAKRALVTKTPVPVAIAACGAISTGYHTQKLFNMPPRPRYVPGSSPLALRAMHNPVAPAIAMTPLSVSVLQPRQNRQDREESI